MVSNRRFVTTNASVGSQASASTQIADSYSDNLIDDLFSDVDRILEGDLSDYMTVVGHKPKPTNQSTRTVTLPNNFVPRSAAELYQATMSAQAGTVEALRNTPRNTTRNTEQTSRPPAPPMNPYYGGRPVTSRPATASTTASQGQPSRTQTTTQGTLLVPAVASAPYRADDRADNRAGNRAANDPGIYDTTRVTHPEVLQSLPNFSYTDPMPELTLSPISPGRSPRPPQTIFEPKRSVQPQPKSQSVSLPFLLVGAASISAVSTLGLWTFGHSEPGHGWLLSLAKEASAAEIPNNSDEEFLEYLQESLAVISARQAETQQLATVIPVAQAATLPTTVPNTNATPKGGALPNLPGATRPQSVIERVFVPVYENQTNAKVATASSPAPNVTVPSNNAKPKVPVPAPVAAAAAIPQGAPAAATPSVPIVPNNSLPAPAPVAAAPTNAAAKITDVTPTSDHVLVGVLNLGSRSAALFDIDGSSQRAYVGDRIGLSDWSLVAVNGQDVVIRRDGEVRSVYIGQTF